MTTTNPELEAFREHLSEKLRQPLNAVIGFAELLALQPRGAHSANDVQRILTAARDLLEVVNREITNPARSEESAPAARIARCDVLYIEDDDVNYMLVERIFEYRPLLTLQHANTGEAGLAMARTERPRLILLDLNLPDMHGADVLRQLRENPVTADIPVVVLSANATPSHIERLLSAGARNYVTKPFDIDPFLAVVDEFTGELAPA
jgi:CheY-like chemotaxis protein